ncbi:recQ-like DNA helicase Blm isoform X2 [Cloeon dipterum]|uniref:recQ-like DNA helicase Blm isoform X2 n=1 Tax=Cloeon dipterum TaxID=197152 RepID=UPI00321FCDDC
MNFFGRGGGGGGKNLSLRSHPGPGERNVQTSITSFLPKSAAPKTGIDAAKPVAKILPQADALPKSGFELICEKKPPANQNPAPLNGNSGKKKRKNDNPFVSSSDDDTDLDTFIDNRIDEVTSEDSPKKSPVIERRSKLSLCLSQARKPLFPAVKTPENSFNFTAAFELSDADDSWDDEPKSSTFQVKKKVAPSVPTPAPSIPKAVPKPSTDPPKPIVNFDANFLLSDDDDILDVTPEKAPPPKAVPVPSKLEKFDCDVRKWASVVDSLQPLRSDVSRAEVEEVKKRLSGLMAEFSELCIAMLSLDLKQVAPSTAVKLRIAAQKVKAKLLLAEKRHPSASQDDVPLPSASQDTTHLPSTFQGTRNLPSASQGTTNLPYSFQGTMPIPSATQKPPAPPQRQSNGYPDASPAVQRDFSFPTTSPQGGNALSAAGPAQEMDLMGAIFNKPSPKSKLSLNNGKFHGKLKNDADNPLFQGFNHPHSQQLKRLLKEKFGLSSFRTNQLQAMNAALLGHNCFVLMPTGGGKSLCYQLPALVTGGVTIVVSPLKSLIQDQVNKLNTLGIPAAHLSGDMTAEQINNVYNELRSGSPKMTLLYVTPEKLGMSKRLVDALRSLHQRRQLSRFVIDEAHCVSNWGHDFRPDYQKLSALKENFPSVPTMALTATATQLVRTDILRQLRMDDPKWFLSSFNRPNLKYSVLEKVSKAKSGGEDQLLTLLQQPTFRNKSGIVYCFSRNDCQNTAEKLKQHGVRAAAYHAGMTDKQRNAVQHQWTTGTLKVICATIAFGMGIDKPDVRFVVHNSLAKSIEGYYQEAGRAGRDGQLAHCILLYSYADVKKILTLIESDGKSREAVQVHRDNVYRMQAFCTNKLDCRRVLQLSYFGENFSRELCLRDKSAACDNCLNQGEYVEFDFLSLAREIVQCARTTCGYPGSGTRVTQLDLANVLRGSKAQKIVSLGLDQLPIHGKAASLSRADVERLLQKLVVDNFLSEEFLSTVEDRTAAYVRLGPKHDAIFSVQKFSFAVKKPKEGTLPQTPAVCKPSRDEELLLDIQSGCLLALQEKLREIATALGKSPHTVCNPQALVEMSKRLPETREQMLNVTHVTETNFNVFGQQLLEITKTFASTQQEVLASYAADVISDDDDEGENLLAVRAPASTSTQAPSQRGRGGGGGRGGFRSFGGRKFGKKRKGKTAAGPARKKQKAGGGGGGGYVTSRGPSGETVTTRPGLNSRIQNMPVPVGRGNIRNLKVSSFN